MDRVVSWYPDVPESPYGITTLDTRSYRHAVFSSVKATYQIRNKNLIVVLQGHVWVRSRGRGCGCQREGDLGGRVVNEIQRRGCGYDPCIASEVIGSSNFAGRKSGGESWRGSTSQDGVNRT